MNNDDTAQAYEPKVVAFCCTYCAYAAGDLTGSMRLEYSANVRVVKVPCSGKVDPVLLLKTFDEGADAVYVAGCAIGDCHFLEGNLRAIRAVTHVKFLLSEIGLEPERLEFFHIPASDAPLFADRADEMTERARQLGPNPLRDMTPDPPEDRQIDIKDTHPPLPDAKLGRLIRHAERVKRRAPVQSQ